MFKNSCLAILPFLFSCSLHSQNSVSGKITDAKQAPVPYCVVALLLASDSTLIQGKITDENGLYTFTEIKNGNYFLKISTTGFEPVYSSIFTKDSLNDLVVSDVSISGARLLDAVTISSITPTIEFKNGNIIVNVEGSPLARGNSVYDLLSKLPGVSIINNVVTLQGRSGVIFMIDGRVQQMSNEQLLNQLKGMSAATIQKIEVLKNPPVKYDAAGTSGMINIVTKKHEQIGFNGAVYSETSQGVYNSTSYGLALNYKNEKVSIFSSIDGTYNTYLVNTGNAINFESDSGQTEIDNDNDYKILETDLNFKFGADWYANKSNVIGFKLSGGPGKYNENGIGLNKFIGYNNTGFDNYLFSEVGHNKWDILNYNLNAEHYFDTVGTLLSFSADFTSLKENDKSLYESHFYNANNTEILVPNIFQIKNNGVTQLFSANSDFIHSFDSTSTIEFGLKGSSAFVTNEYLFEQKDSTTSQFNINPALSTDYIYTEQNFAGYFNYSKSFKFFNLNLGLRGEKTSVEGSSSVDTSYFTKNYFNLFPNASFEYSKSENHVFQLNLNRRIDRPTFDQLNPFLIYVDQYSFYSGNPFVQPDYSNTAAFTYSYKGIINNSISYSHINKYIDDLTEQIDSTKILATKTQNLNFSDAYSYLLFIKYDFTNLFEVTINTNVSYLVYDGEISNFPFRSRGLSYDANLSNTFLLPGKTKLEISGLYRGPSLFGPILIDPVWSASFAIQKSFFKEKLDCSIGMNDVFNTFKFHTHSKFQNQNWNFYQSSDSRRISLSLSYNFGKTKAEEREMNSNETEKERLSH